MVPVPLSRARNLSARARHLGPKRGLVNTAASNGSFARPKYYMLGRLVLVGWAARKAVVFIHRVAYFGYPCLRGKSNMGKSILSRP